MKKTGTMFIKNLRYLCLIGVIALGLMTIVGTGGGGGGGGGTATPTDTTTDGDGEVTVGEAIDTSHVTFSVENALSLIATENIGTSTARHSVRRDGKAIPTYVFRKPTTEAEARAGQANARQGEEEVGCNLIAIDEDGVASDALESLEELNVMYTVLSKDQKRVFVVLDPDYMHNSQNTIGATNCMMFAVDLQTNEYTCLDQGYSPQKMDNEFITTISSSTAKPIQMDDDGNIYYLGRPFTVNSNTWCEEWDNAGNCVREHTDYWLEFDWNVQPVIRMITVKKDADGNPLYNEDGELLYEDAIGLTPDVDYIDSFLVSRDGILVYTFVNWETGAGGIKMYADGATNALTGDDTSGWWGDMFYVIGDGGTVIYGSGSAGWGTGGVKFAQRHPVVAGARVVCQLDTSLFTSRNNSPTPSRIMIGDDGYIYGLFNEDTSYWDESQGTHVSQARINLFRILPYKQTPIISFEVTGNWWDALRGFDVQISKGYAYYIRTDKHPQNLYSDRNAIKITKLATGDTTTLLNTSHTEGIYTIWDDRYELYSWKLVGSKIHFSGFDSNASQVVTGEIDITKLRQGKPSTEYLIIREAASALGESARIRDMEILHPEVVYDPVGAPVITKIYTDPENRYSASIDFSKYMNRTDVKGKTSIKDVGADQEVAYTMKVWSYRTLHLIFDSDATNATTDPLAANTLYQISVDGSAFDLANDWQLDMVEDPLLSTTFKTVPDQGWYQSTAIALEGYSDGSVGKYVRAENMDTGLDFYRLLGTKANSWTGTSVKNFRLELSVQYLGDSWHHWNALQIRLNDAQKADWESVDWSQATITDNEGFTWEWRDGYRTDDDGNKYCWCNYEHCEKPIEQSTGTAPGWIDGVYRQDNGYIYIREEGSEVDVDGNTYYWYWEDETQQSGYLMYDSAGKSGGNLLATIVWVEGYYTDEQGTKYIWSFGEYRNENNPDDIIDWESGKTYTWTSGYHMNKDTREVFEMPWLEWVPGKYVATYDDNGDPIPSDDAFYQDEFSENSWWSWTEEMGYYVKLDSQGNETETTQTWWDDSWMTQVTPAYVENTKKDNWEARLFRLEFDAAGRISGEYRWGDWDQSWFDVMSTSNEETKREWRKIIVSVYGSNVDISVLDEDGNVITSWSPPDAQPYDNTPGDGSGTYFLDLNVNSNLMMDNIVVTELNADGTDAGNQLFEETFSSSVLSSTWSDPGQYTSEW